MGRLAAMLLSTLVVLASDASALNAQILPDSLIDRRVRVELARQDRSIEGYVARQAVRGTLLAVGSDSITLQVHPDAAPFSVASNGIRQIEVSRGVSRSRTAIKSALGGAALWAGIGAQADSEFGGGETENVLIWAAGGFLFGAILGNVLPEEQWKRVFRR